MFLLPIFPIFWKFSKTRYVLRYHLETTKAMLFNEENSWKWKVEKLPKNYLFSNLSMLFLRAYSNDTFRSDFFNSFHLNKCCTFYVIDVLDKLLHFFHYGGALMDNKKSDDWHPFTIQIGRKAVDLVGINTQNNLLFSLSLTLSFFYF